MYLYITLVEWKELVNGLWIKAHQHVLGISVSGEPTELCVRTIIGSTPVGGM